MASRAGLGDRRRRRGNRRRLRAQHPQRHRSGEKARSLALLALADLGLQLAVIVVGAPRRPPSGRPQGTLHFFSDPSFKDIVYAAVVAMLAYAGIEAASDLAPDINVDRRDLNGSPRFGAVAVPLVYAGMAAIALMAVPVVAGPDGPENALGGQFVEEPVLGVVSAFHPGWVADSMRWMVALVAAPVLFWAANTSMLGVSRHIYTLAINRQTQLAGKAGARKATPYVAIAISGVIASAWSIPTNVKLLAGIYAFGATLAITIAHLSIIRLRVRDPDRRGPSGSRWEVPWRGAELPLPAIVAAILSGLAFVSVLFYHEIARLVGGGWMVFGLVFYVVYRKVFEGTTLTKRVSVTERALTKQVPEVEFRNILVPVFGTKLDDDIVATAGRLAAAEQAESGKGEGKTPGSRLVYVIEVPLTLPLDAALPPEREEEARRALERAREVGEEYEDVGHHHRGDPCPQGRRRHPRGGPAQRFGGDRDRRRAALGRSAAAAKIGGIGGAKPAEIGAATEYVLKKAPCRVLLTAPPEAP